jgi:parallel beta-helix repeat protein
MIRITRRVRRDSAYLIFVLILHSNLLCQAIPNIVARENKYVANNAENLYIGDIFVPDNYTTIQGAINAASEGNTIVVRSGLYIEHVGVNKAVNLIGEGYPVIEGSGSSGFWGGACIMVSAHNVTVTGFVLQHTGPLRESDGALGLAGISNCNVTGNVLRFSRGGIDMSTGDHNHTISDNLFQNLEGCAIWLNGYYITVSNNVMSSCGGGIVVGYPQNSLINNTITDCPTFGVLLNAYLITMRLNTINETRYGFVTVEYLLSQLNNDIDTTNTVDGRPIYYWINQSDRRIPLDAGYVALINSTNISADNLDLGRNGHGVLIAYSNNCT